jgi:spore germination cell wall hydrolase CwlJ-like protein
MQNEKVSLLLLTAIFTGLVSSLPAQNITITVSQTEVVAATLIMEAGGEGRQGMEAVREVIANRAKNKSEIIVCLAPKQFSCWNGIAVGTGIDKARKHPRWELALKIAKAAPTNHTKGSTHYHTTKVSPSWAKKLAQTVKIKNHIFYR